MAAAFGEGVAESSASGDTGAGGVAAAKGWGVAATAGYAAEAVATSSNPAK